MTPMDLMQLCRTSILQWENETIRSDEPMVLLVIPRSKCPRGDSVALFGRSGPKGRIATIKESANGYDVVAYFPARAIVDAIGKAMMESGPHHP